MDMIFIDTVLCELATNYETSLIYSKGLDANRGCDSCSPRVLRGRDNESTKGYSLDPVISMVVLLIFCQDIASLLL